MVEAARRRAGVVGAHVTTSTAASAGPSISSIAAASHGRPARALRYFTRAMSSRATPSYTNATASVSSPAGGSRRGAGRNVAAHAAQTGSAGAPHPGQTPGAAPRPAHATSGERSEALGH